MKILIRVKLLLIYFSMCVIASLSLASTSPNKTMKTSKVSKITQPSKSTKEAKIIAKNQKISSKSLEQKMIFNDRLVNGKHQVPGAGVVTVENEKPLLNLISIRTDFKDRRAKELQRD